MWRIFCNILIYIVGKSIAFGPTSSLYFLQSLVSLLWPMDLLVLRMVRIYLGAKIFMCFLQSLESVLQLMEVRDFLETVFYATKLKVLLFKRRMFGATFIFLTLIYFFLNSDNNESNFGKLTKVANSDLFLCDYASHAFFDTHIKSSAKH